MKRCRLTGLALALALVAGCHKSKPAVEEPAPLPADGAGSGSGSAEAAPAPPAPPPVPDQDIDSKDILARTGGTAEVQVKHVLLAWKELAPVYGGRMDRRAELRSNAEAAKLALDVAAALRAKPDDIDAQIKLHSEDPGSLTGTPYTVSPDAPFVPEFKNLALRLQENEIGIVRSQFGYHVMERVLPPPPDPLQSANILARTTVANEVHVRHVLLGWKDTPRAQRHTADPKSAERTKEEADKLAVEVLAKVRKGADITKLMKELSEDLGTADSGSTLIVDGSSNMVEPFKSMALRLKLNEAGLAKTDFGWHIIKRVPPPPLDKLESKAILARKPLTERANVKHILVGWSGLNADDARAKARTRAELDALVKKTLAALKKGDPIEPLMQELSEDPGSSTSGAPYVATPDSGLVKPFKDLSLRLKVGEVGVVKTQFGFHIIKRMPDEAPAEPAAPEAAPAPAGN